MRVLRRGGFSGALLAKFSIKIGTQRPRFHVIVIYYLKLNTAKVSKIRYHKDTRDQSVQYNKHYIMFISDNKNNKDIKHLCFFHLGLHSE
ncbi:hypothetical protein Hanom_Chr16g01498261 [Helianthus anomalus]